MKYETIEAAFPELAKRGIIFLASTWRGTDGHSSVYLVARREIQVHNGEWTNRTIDLMYSILSEIGYTMYPERHVLKDGATFYVPVYVENNGIFLCLTGSDGFSFQRYNTPEQCFPPAFLAAINHFLEQSNG